MNFGVFRKYQKPLLWVTVVFCVLIFATFSGMDDLRALITGTDPDRLGRFTTQPGGQEVVIGQQEFSIASQDLGRLSRLSGGKDVTEDEIWAYLMHLADANEAGLQVSAAEIAQFITGGNQEIARSYHENEIFRNFRYSSARDFERAMADFLKVQNWRALRARTSQIVAADEVFLQWRQDNELFDFEALVFDDLAPEELEDPGDETLEAWFDEMPEGTRAFRFKEPATFDIAYAALPFDAPLDAIPAEILESLPEPAEQSIRTRYLYSLEEFTPEAMQKELTDEETALIADQVRIESAAQTALAVYNALTEEDQGVEPFQEIMEAHGLVFVDPEGLMGPEELEALDGFSENAVQTWLGRTQAGKVVQVRGTFGASHVLIAFVQERTEDVPLAFAEARDQVLEAWKEDQADRMAQEFRDELTARAEHLPEVLEVIEPLRAAALDFAEGRIAEDPELDEEGKQRIREEALAEEEGRIAERISEHEHKVWSAVVTDFSERVGVERQSLTGVSRAYASNPDEADEEGGFARWLKGNRQITAMAVDAVTTVLRHGPSSKSAVVRVAGRRFPAEEAMYVDSEGLEQAIQRLSSNQRLQSFQQVIDPDNVKLEHELELVVLEELPASS